MTNDVFTLDENNNAAIRTLGVKAGTTETNSPSVFTTDENGNAAIRVTGGGDQNNLGYFTTLQALQEAYPTAEAGNWAIVGATDTVWIWDTDTSAWVDSDTKGQVTSVNNQTGAVTVQETLVSGTNIKTIDGNSVLGSGNLELSTYLTYPAGWTTNGTTKAFCDDIAADASAVVGKAYLGEVTLSDLPASMVNGEIVVEIMDGTTAANKVIVLSLKSGNVAPYAWQYVYWNGGSNTSGWQTWQEPLVSGTNIKTINGASVLGSGDITTEAIQVSTMPTAGADNLGDIVQFKGTTDANYTNGYFYKCVSDGQNPATYSWTQVNVQPAPSGLPSQTGQSGKFLTTDGTDASWSDRIKIDSDTTIRSYTPSGRYMSIYQSQNGNSANIGFCQADDRKFGEIGFSDNLIYFTSKVGQYTSRLMDITNTALFHYGDNATLGVPSHNWKNVYTTKLNNGADINVPTTGGTLAVIGVNTTITLVAADWSSNTQTVNVTGMTATGVVFPCPIPADQADYTDAGIICSAQAAGTLTFTCDTVPSNDIDVTVVMM